VLRASEVLFQVGLEEERSRLIRTFSVGMRQRTNLAQAIVHSPSLVILDEPTNGLDPAGREEMLTLVQFQRFRADLASIQQLLDRWRRSPELLEHCLKIGPYLAFRRGIAQKIRWVKSRHHRNGAVKFPLTAHAGNAAAHAEKPFERGGTEGHDHLRRDELELLAQVGLASRHFGRVRLAVFRRPTLDDVAHVDVVAQKTHGGDHSIEELPGFADEGKALRVLFGSRALADETELGGRVAAVRYTATTVTVNLEAAPDHLAFLQQPTNTVAGVAMSPAATVKVLDQYNNLVDTDTSNVTISWNQLGNHNKTLGIGWTENVTARETIHHNWFYNTNQRNPSADNLAYAHLYNNYLQNITSYGNYSRGSTKMVLENSYFDHVNNPYYPDSTAQLRQTGSILVSCTGTQATSGSAFSSTANGIMHSFHIHCVYRFRRHVIRISQFVKLSHV